MLLFFADDEKQQSFKKIFFSFFNRELKYKHRLGAKMKKTYHLCLSGGNEVMCRHDRDYIHANNCLCLAVHKTDSSLLAYSIMSNHAHIGVRTEDPHAFMKSFRYPYNRYFNQKYGRKGMLGEKHFFICEIDGLYHRLAMISYILRNALHHGVSATPFGYRYSSISALFREDLGYFDEPELMPKKSQYLYLPGNDSLPEGYKMGASGLILPQSVIDVSDVEHQFSTARTFLYYMNRLSGEAWEKEQLQDAVNMPPVTIEQIESSIKCQDLKTMLGNEHGRANYNAMNDIRLCGIVDKMLGESSVYEIPQGEIERVARYIYNSYRVSQDQINRCLAGRLLVDR